jgi:D-alanyl-D-alanine carboxypeptidase
MRGVTAAVVTPQGSWTGAVGVDGDGQPLDPNAMMGVGAITQTITAAEVLALTASGRIDLDAPMSAYLAHPTLQRDPTVRQLLSHTSGIPDYVTPQFLTAVTTDPTRSWTGPEVLQYTPDNLTDPGPPFHYSNSDYVLLGLLIEAITGQPYETAAFHGVLDGTGARLVLQDAQLPIPPLAAPDHTDGGTPDGHFLPNRSIASSAGASGGAAADAATLAAWGYRLYGGRVLPPDLTAELSDPVTPGYGLGTLHLDSAPVRPATGPAQDPQLTGLGAIGHDGGIPGYSSTLIVIPHRSMSIAVLIVGPELVAIETHIITAGLLTAMN